MIDSDSSLGLPVVRKRSSEALNIRKQQKIEKEKIEAEKRKEKALIQLRYLLSVSESFSDQLKKKANKTLIDRSVVTVSTNDIESVKKGPKKCTSLKQFNIEDHMQFLEGGTLYPYQKEGVNWMYMLYENSLNGILADEMGLGKTIQVIALLSILYAQNVNGPHLIVVPLSTLPNWESEFKKFAPKIPVVSIKGSKELRTGLSKLIHRKYQVGGNENLAPVVLCAYHTLLTDREYCYHAWKFIIVDEAQRIKNHKSQLAIKLRQLRSEYRLLLTGTPIQNNMVELWALLNFILPNYFKDMSAFTELFLMDELKDQDKFIKQEKEQNLVSKIHKVLTPFMLRRLKSEVFQQMIPKKEVIVYCPMTEIQKKLYNNVIDYNIQALRGKSLEEPLLPDAKRPKRKCTNDIKYDFDYLFNMHRTSHSTRERRRLMPMENGLYHKIRTYITMQNTMMMFRKIVSHPYLVQFPLDLSSKTEKLLIDENLVQSSGKLIVLDTLLPKLKKRGHKVLLFSQLAMGLDLIEEFVIMRNYKYCRLDGSRKLEERAKNIQRFNEDPDIFIFLLTTRAGGLGLNLTAADTVIFFDRDWNPQIDIQAQNRCHRIGQTKPVVVYTLVSKNTIDDTVIARGKLKKLLQKIVILDGRFKNKATDDKLTISELTELRNVLEEAENDSYIFSNKMELNKLLDRSDMLLNNKRTRTRL